MNRFPRVPRVPVAVSSNSGKGGGGNAGVVAFATLVAGAFFSVPFVAHFVKEGNLNSQEKPLNVSAIRRGAYQNNGSRDVGVDKDWDFATNTWHGRRGRDAAMARAAKASDANANANANATTTTDN